MTAAILTLIGTLLGLVAWLWKRHAAKEDDPLQQHRERYAQIDSDLAKGNSTIATDHATSDLDELERLQKRQGH